MTLSSPALTPDALRAQARQHLAFAREHGIRELKAEVRVDGVRVEFKIEREPEADAVEWRRNTNYPVGEVVVHGGAFFRLTTELLSQTKMNPPTAERRVWEPVAEADLRWSEQVTVKTGSQSKPKTVVACPGAWLDEGS